MRFFSQFKTAESSFKYKLNRCLQKKCCKQWRQVKSRDTMIKKPVQKQIYKIVHTQNKKTLKKVRTQ